MCSRVVEPSGFCVLGFCRCPRRSLSVNKDRVKTRPLAHRGESLVQLAHEAHRGEGLSASSGMSYASSSHGDSYSQLSSSMSSTRPATVTVVPRGRNKKQRVVELTTDVLRFVLLRLCVRACRPAAPGLLDSSMHVDTSSSERPTENSHKSAF